jgi:hypothetical protein
MKLVANVPRSRFIEMTWAEKIMETFSNLTLHFPFHCKCFLISCMWASAKLFYYLIITFFWSLNFQVFCHEDPQLHFLMLTVNYNLTYSATVIWNDLLLENRFIAGFISKFKFFSSHCSHPVPLYPLSVPVPFVYFQGMKAMNMYWVFN